MECAVCRCEMKPARLPVSLQPEEPIFTMKHCEVEALVCPQCGKIELRVRDLKKLNELLR